MGTREDRLFTLKQQDIHHQSADNRQMWQVLECVSSNNSACLSVVSFASSRQGADNGPTRASISVPT